MTLVHKTSLYEINYSVYRTLTIHWEGIIWESYSVSEYIPGYKPDCKFSPAPQSWWWTGGVSALCLPGDAWLFSGHLHYWKLPVLVGWREPGNSIKDLGIAITGVGFIVLLLYDNTWPGISFLLRLLTVSAQSLSVTLLSNRTSQNILPICKVMFSGSLHTLSSWV